MWSLDTNTLAQFRKQRALASIKLNWVSISLPHSSCSPLSSPPRRLLTHTMTPIDWPEQDDLLIAEADYALFLLQNTNHTCHDDMNATAPTFVPSLPCPPAPTFENYDPFFAPFPPCDFPPQASDQRRAVTVADPFRSIRPDDRHPLSPPRLSRAEGVFGRQTSQWSGTFDTHVYGPSHAVNSLFHVPDTHNASVDYAVPAPSAPDIWLGTSTVTQFITTYPEPTGQPRQLGHALVHMGSAHTASVVAPIVPPTVPLEFFPWNQQIDIPPAAATTDIEASTSEAGPSRRRPRKTGARGVKASSTNPPRAAAATPGRRQARPHQGAGTAAERDSEASGSRCGRRRRTAEPKPRVPCPIAGCTTTCVVGALKRHVDRKHLEPRKREEQCEGCGRIFARGETMRRHVTSEVCARVLAKRAKALAHRDE